VLSYVAPVLGKATQVRGTIAGDVRTADIPITGPPERTMTLNGHMAFQDVVFSPGPGAIEVLSLLGKADIATLKMEQPVELSVANRRVYQKGLAMTIRNDARLSLEGSVGFDKTLDLRAGVPITQAMLGGGQTVANELLADKTVTVPIGGTVARPIVNKDALRVALGELSRGVLKKELSREAAKLLKLPQTQTGANGAESDAVVTPDQVEALGNELIRRITPRRRK
jgi:translocation and assembly module TamB